MSTQFTNRQWRLPNNENKDKQSNYSMDFDGITEYVDLGDADVFSFGNGSTDSPFSISAWVKMDNATNFSIISKSDNTNGNSEYLFYTDALNRITLLLYSAVSTNRYRGRKYSVALTEGVWMHLAATYDGQGGVNAQDGIKIYLNGASVDNTDISNGTYDAMPNGNAPLEIGVKGNQRSNGQIDAVSIFNYALTDGTGGTVNQIAALYGSSSTGIGNPMSLSPKPVAMYNLGDKSAFNNSNYLIPNSSLKDYVFDFDGVDDYVDCGNDSSLMPTTALSISFWMEGVGSGDDFPLRCGSTTLSNNYGYGFRVVSSTDYWFILGNGTTYSSLRISSPAPSAGWHHFLCTWDGTTQTMFIDGASVGTATFATTLAYDAGAFFIGGRSTTGSKNFEGKMSNVQIFNTALPATGSNSVETLYNNGSPLTSMSGFTSLVGFWKLDASATYDGSNWTIPDDSSNSNDGTSSGMTQANLVQSDLSFTSGYSPYALDFDGANDYIDCGDSDDFSFGDGTNDSPFSLSAWVYFIDASTSAGIIAKYAGTNATKEWMIYTSPQNFRLILQDGAYNNFATATSTTIQTNQWYNIITTYDGRGDANANQGINIYVNGQLQTLSYTGSSSYVAMNNTNAAVRIGRYGTGNYFNGSISNCSIWNTELTQAQVTELYNEGVPSNLNNHSAYSNLVSWWQLGSNSSFNTNWTVLDEKGSNNGTSVNMTEADIVDGVGSYANGLSSGMGGDEVIGDAPYSTANSLSVNMDVLDRVEDTPS